MLANVSGIDLTVVFGQSFLGTASTNAPGPYPFRHIQLATIDLSFTRNGSKQPRGLHPGIVCVLARERFDVLIGEASTNFYTDLLAIPTARAIGSSVVFWSADCLTAEVTWQRKLIQPVLLRWFRQADAIISYNSSTDEYFLYYGIAKEKIFRAQNAINTREIRENWSKLLSESKSIRAREGFENSLVVIFVGGVEKRKRIENMLLACQELVRKGIPCRPVVIGAGEHFVELRRFEQSLSDIDTIFTGRITEGVHAWVLASDVVVLPGQGGLTINDALACGKPVIATTEAVAGGDSVRDYIKDGQNGFVVSANSSKAIADKLFLLAGSRSMREQMGEETMRLSRTCSIERMVQGFVDAIYFCVGKGQAI